MPEHETRAEYEARREPVSWGLVLFVLAATFIVVGIPLSTWLVAQPSEADLEQARWERCVESAEEFGFDPPGGAEAWCLTNGGV